MATTTSVYVDPNTGGVQAGLMQFRNAIINGDMRINQRGTSTNLASMTAVATASPGSWVTDRWNVFRPSNVTGAVIAQGLNLGTTNLPFIEAGVTTFARIGRLTGNTLTDQIKCTYNMESQDSIRFAGKTTTFSFYYRTGANFSASPFYVGVNTGTGNDQSMRNTITGGSNPSYTELNVALNWVKVTKTFNISSVATQIFLQFSYYPTGTADAADYFDITGVQLELGSVATPFETRPYSVELQLCQRYLYKISGKTGVNSTVGSGYFNSFNDGVIFIPTPPNFRQVISLRLTTSAGSAIQGVYINQANTSYTDNDVYVQTPTNIIKMSQVQVNTWGSVYCLIINAATPSSATNTPLYALIPPGKFLMFDAEL
jgi:hypothetical protein